MILPGLFPSSMRTRPVVRYTEAIDDARTSSTTIDLTTSALNARAGDLVIFTTYGSYNSSPTISNNAGLTQTSSTSVTSWKFFDGTEPSTIRWTASGGAYNYVSLLILVVSGLQSLVSISSASSSSSSVLQITSPARFWVIDSLANSDTSDVSVPPAGYGGYQKAGISGVAIRSAYRVVDEITQLGGNWANLPAQAVRRSWAFR
jgi:hypothetical protein